MTAGGAAVATLNVNNFDLPHPFVREGVPMRYDDESEPRATRQATAGWTPAVAFEVPPRRA